jgi:hypothetical protein
VPLREGTDFAAHNELMIAYRQAIFSRVANAVSQIGLMTPRVRTGLERLDLIRFTEG